MRPVIEDDLAAFLTARLDEDEQDTRSLLAVAQWQTGRRRSDDPAWVSVQMMCVRALRDVEAKRARHGLYLDAKEALAAALAKAPPEDDPATAHSYVRERINVNQASGRFAALEMSVRLDARAWDDHPGYRQEWKP